MMKNYLNIYSLFVAMTFLMACDDDFLDVKPDKALVVPSTLEDMQALIYNDIRIMNVDPPMGEVASDDFINLSVAGLNILDRNSYLWADDIYEGSSLSPDWNIPYQQVFYANVALEGLNNIPVNTANREEWETTKGGALFYRAWAYNNLAKVFTLPYNPANATSTLGLPLRLKADVNARPSRSNLQETYEQILEDLTAAAKLLPTIAEHKTQPSKVTTHALKARVYLIMHDYENAEVYADSCLQLYNSLLDYDLMNATARAPFPRLNDEVIFHSTFITISYLFSALTVVDPDLYNSYEDNDLRRTLFFSGNSNGHFNFKGSYNGNIVPFSGIATDEVYLIRAESRARLGDISGAMADLNTLMVTRWKEGTFVPFAATTKEEALELILEERRKELIFRGTRWADLKRLNHYPEYAKTLVREVGAETFTLPPGDVKYAFPIPDAEIRGSGIQQNPR